MHIASHGIGLKTVLAHDRYAFQCFDRIPSGLRRPLLASVEYTQNGQLIAIDAIDHHIIW
jgi:hypothetical protein